LPLPTQVRPSKRRCEKPARCSYRCGRYAAQHRFRGQFHRQVRPWFRRLSRRRRNGFHCLIFRRSSRRRCAGGSCPGGPRPRSTTPPHRRRLPGCGGKAAGSARPWAQCLRPLPAPPESRFRKHALSQTESLVPRPLDGLSVDATIAPGFPVELVDIGGTRKGTASQAAEKRHHRFFSHWQRRTGGPYLAGFSRDVGCHRC
jgi:hypothetical protein